MTSAHALNVDKNNPSPRVRESMKVSPLGRTLVIPLWARAEEMRKRTPMLMDDRARDISNCLDFDFRIFRRAYGTQLGCVIRGLLFDEWVQAFLRENPDGTVVELGVGLSTRFERIDNGSARWVEVDLPDVIALRRRFFEPSDRRTLLPTSAIDPELVTKISDASPGPYLFVAEGMLMYLDPPEVRSLFVRLANGFAHTRIVFDSISPLVVRHQRLHDSMKHMMDAPFRWGLSDVRDLEAWDRRLRVSDSATLPDIARRFSGRVALRHRITGSIIQRALPAFANAYRLTRLDLRRA